MATHKRINEKTPSGGIYAEMFFFDAEGHPADEEEARRCIIQEFDANGNLINETVSIG